MTQPPGVGPPSSVANRARQSKERPQRGLRRQSVKFGTEEFGINDREFDAVFPEQVGQDLLALNLGELAEGRHLSTEDRRRNRRDDPVYSQRTQYAWYAWPLRNSTGDLYQKPDHHLFSGSEQRPGTLTQPKVNNGKQSTARALLRAAFCETVPHAPRDSAWCSTVCG